jgi:uncharacterized protein
MSQRDRTLEYTIPTSELDAAGRAYVFPVRSAWLLGALEDHEAKPAPEDGELSIRLSKSGADVVLHGHLRAGVVMPCARCLEPVRIDVSHEVATLFVPESKLRALASSGGKRDDDEVELSSEDADMVPYDGDTVVLDDWLRDEVILETPMIPLCSEDCPGITPGPQARDAEPAETGIDPRLLPLLKLKGRTRTS